MPFLAGTASQAFNLAVVNEFVANGDGIQTVYNFAVAKPPARLDSFTGTYDTGSPQSWTTDSAGNITGTDITSGTFDGTNASITFTVAPTANPINCSYTALGVLAQVVDFVTNGRLKHSETVGTGDGIQTVFSTTLSNTTIVAGQLLIRFKIGGVVYWAYDDGSGVFDHPQISTGTIVYATGVLNLTFLTAIDNTFNIEAIYTTSAIAGRDWLLLRNETSRDTAGVESYSGELLEQYWLKNAGFSQKVNNNGGGVTLGFRESKIVASDIFCIQGNIWRTFGEQEYTSTSFISNDAVIPALYTVANGTLNLMPTMGLDDSPVAFWCSCTRSHILIVVRSLGVIYTHMIGGVMNPFSTFESYPFPGFVKGNSAAPVALGTQNNHVGIHRNQATAGAIHMYESDGSYNRGDTSVYRILPRDNWSGAAVLKNTTDNKVILRNVQFYNLSNDYTYFELVGLKFCPTNQIQAEDTILDQNTRNYIIFPEHTKTNEEDFFAVDTDL